MNLKFMQEPMVRLMDNPLLIASAQRQLRKKGINLILGSAALISFTIIVIAVQFQNMPEDLRLEPQKFWGTVRAGLSWLILYHLYLKGMNDVITGVNEDQKTGIFDFLRATPIQPISNAIGYIIGLNAKNYLFAFTLLPVWFFSAYQEGIALTDMIFGYAFMLIGGFVLHHVALVIGLFAKGKRLSWAGSTFLILLMIVAEGLDQGGIHTLAHITPFPVLNTLNLTLMSDFIKSNSILFYRFELHQIAYTSLVYAWVMGVCLWLAHRQLNRSDLPVFGKDGLLLGFGSLIIILIGSDLNPEGLGAFAKMNKMGALLPGALIYLLGSTLMIVLLLINLAPTRRLAFKEIERAHLQKTSIPFLADGASLLPYWACLSLIQILGFMIYLFAYHADPWGILLDFGSARSLFSALVTTFCVAGLSEGIRIHDLFQYRTALTLSMSAILIVPLILGELLRQGELEVNFFHGLSPIYGLYSAIQGLSVNMVSSETEKFLEINMVFYWTSLLVALAVGLAGFKLADDIKKEKKV